MTDTPQTLSERDEIEMLLPWYVTGRLEAPDRLRVEAWLKRDPSLTRQLDHIADDRAQSVLSNEALALPRTLNVQQAMQQIVPAPSGAASWIGQLKGFFAAPTARGVGWAAAAAVALVLLQSLWIGSLLVNRTGAGYQVASGGQSTPADGAYALVRFSDTATMSDIAAALTALDMSVAGGPRPGNLFRVRIGDAGLSEAARSERIAALQRRPGLTTLVTPTK